MASGGGGAWKVAYADFVTAMMAFFMVMWLTSQKPEVKKAVAGYFTNPYATYPGAESGLAADPSPAENPKPGHEAPPQRREIPNSGDETNYQFSVYFANDSAEVDVTARELIRTIVPTMIGKLNRVEIRAHCQRKPLAEGSPFESLWDLCYARSRAVQKELEAQGIDEDRFLLGQAESNEPMANNLSEEELNLNSRVDIKLLPDLVDAPWHDSSADADEPVTRLPEPVSRAPLGHAPDDHHEESQPHADQPPQAEGH